MKPSGSTSRLLLPAFLLPLVLISGHHANGQETIFQLPQRFARMSNQLRVAVALRKDGKLEEAAAAIARSIAAAPQLPTPYVYHARVLLQLGKNKEALQALEKAVANGFRGVQQLASEPEFAVLRGEESWTQLQRKGSQQLKAESLWNRPAVVTEVADGIATVAPENTQWVPQGGILLARFRLPDAATEPVVVGEGEIGRLIRDWYKAGTAAGHHGDFYDNRDRNHSRLRTKAFPQLTQIRYAKAARAANVDYGAQLHLLFEGVVLGNSSTASVGSPFWRGQTRLMGSDQANAMKGWNQYQNNHLYFYPEHKNYDPGHNGKKGHGDVFHANLPYCITSQGSSGSDRPFMRAVAAALAALRPDVKAKLRREKLIAPVLQAVFRRSNKTVATDDDYFSGRAHPPVFRAGNLDAAKMVRLAHSIQINRIPPLATVAVVDESKPVGTEKSESIFTTPAAVCRIHRSTAYERTMVLDASSSRDCGGLPLTWKWVVLQGDPSRIRIRNLKDDASRVELTIAWHPRQSVIGNPKLETNRVDIGCFVANDTWPSPPAIISTYFPDNEDRTYKNGRLASRTYNDNYVDPVLDSAPPGGKLQPARKRKPAK